MDYAALAIRTQALVARSGAPVTLTRGVKAGYDPATSAVTESSEKKYISVAVQDEYNARDIDGTMIRSGDCRFYVAVDAKFPKPLRDDTLTFAGETFTVINTKAIQPGAVVVLWDVQARR